MEVSIKEFRKMLEPIQHRVSYLGEQIEALKGEVDKLLERIRRLEGQREGLVEWGADLHKDSSEDETAPVVADKFQKLTIRASVELIARENGGVLIARDCIRTLRKAGLFPNPKNAGPTVYSVLNRGMKKGVWLRRRPGVYALQDHPADSPSNGHQSLFDSE